MRLSILVVDDDLDLADGLAELLELQGHRVETASDGRDGVRRFASGSFDIVFMDVRMPIMNGVDSFLEIRRINTQAKVVMMTGHQESIVARALEAGALGLMRKPLNVNALLASLNAAARPVALVGDDDPALVQGLSNMLTMRGFKTAVAESGEEALLHSRQGIADVLVLDLKLPVAAGLRAYEDMTRLGPPPRTIIVTNETHDRWPAIDVLCRIPVDTVVTKPVDPGIVLSTIQSIFANTAPPPAAAAL